MKDNQCEIEFLCNHCVGPCVYFIQGKDGCKYKFTFGQDYCESKVAQVNRMVLELKKHGIEIKD